MKARFRILMTASAALLNLAACGEDDSAKSGGGDSVKSSVAGSVLSGRYAGEMSELGIGMEIDFHNDGEALLTMIEGGERIDMECTYQSGESRIALNCFGSSGISLTRLEGGDLEADMDGVIVRLNKS